MNSQKVLRGKTVLLLRVRVGSEARRLKSLGAKVIHFPILNLRSSFLSTTYDLRPTTSFHWIVFTSATGVHLFKKRFKVLPAISKIAAVGPETAKALREAFGRSSDFVPSVFTTERLAKELPLTSTNQSVLLIRSKNADKRMEAILAKRGARFKRLSLYEVTPKKLNPKIASSLKERKISHVFFGSASQAQAFAKNFTAGQLNIIFKRVKVQALAIGPETSLALKGLHIKHRVAQEQTFNGMIERLLNGCLRGDDRT